MNASTPRPRLETTEEVMFFDTDCGGVVHNLAYLRWIETARTRLAALMGMNVAAMASSGCYAVVVRTEADYKRPAVIGDHIHVEAELECLQGVRFWCRFRVLRAGDGELLVTSRQQLALVQMPQGKPTRLPREWQENYGKLKA